MIDLSQPPRFKVGFCTATPNAIEAFDQETLLGLLKRHSLGDWGDLSTEDYMANENALESDSDRLFSRYRLPAGKILWIITEADRSVTTLLLPEDY